MRDYADEAYLHARVYAMKSRLLSSKDYISMAGNRGEPLFAEIAGMSDPAAAGEIIFRRQIAQVVSLAGAAGIYAPLFLAFLRQYEARNAKLVLARAFGMKSLEQWYDIGPYALLERSLLREETSLDGVRPHLAGTYLAEVLEGEESYEGMDARVDLCAARDLCSASAPFTNEGKIDYQKLMGKRIAVDSTIIYLRLRKNYKWDDERIYSILEKRHHCLGTGDWPQVKAVAEMLGRNLEQVPAAGAQERSAADDEHYLEQHYFNWVSAMFHRDFHSIFSVAAYLWLLYYQIGNLFKIIDGRRFGFSPERIIAGIICER
jgi:vacuolar-type H+-ATPase subunit C/Vma6